MQLPGGQVAIFGVNEVGHEDANAEMCAGRDAPWLQDTRAASWWRHWDPVYRDVIMLDREGQQVGVYNLTEHSLVEEANYAALRAMLVNLAG